MPRGFAVLVWTVVPPTRSWKSLSTAPAKACKELRRTPKIRLPFGLSLGWNAGASECQADSTACRAAAPSTECSSPHQARIRTCPTLPPPALTHGPQEIRTLLLPVAILR